MKTNHNTHTSYSHMIDSNHVDKFSYSRYLSGYRNIWKVHDNNTVCALHTLTLLLSFPPTAVPAHIFLRITLWIDFTEAISTSAHVCSLACCGQQVHSHSWERRHVRQSYACSFSYARGDNIHQEGFSPHNESRVYPPAAFRTPMMDQTISLKHRTCNMI